MTGLAALTACSGGGGGNDLQTALGRIANTGNNRSQIYYDDTAALVKLAGASPASVKGFAPLRGFGSSGLGELAAELPGPTSIRLLGENYSISAGTPPDGVSLISGGQDTAKVTSDLTKLGWARKDGRLVAPSLASTNGNELSGTLTVFMAQVSASSGSDVVFGGRGASLTQAGSPSGQTLAQDPLISALAGCLGNVVAAWIGSYSAGPQLRPAPSEVAAGLLSPARNSSVPQAVGCAAWPTATAASTYQRNLTKALANGMSASRGERFSNLLTHVSVRNVGGPDHVVSWQASTPGDAQLVIQLVQSVDLPGLPDCQRLASPAVAGQPGCA
ncbi:MAG: hypothetical protein ACRDNF_11000 [Streptosporangiaceae bacterium]